MDCVSWLADGLVWRVQSGFTFMLGTLQGLTRSWGSAGTVYLQQGGLRAVGFLTWQLVSPRVSSLSLSLFSQSKFSKRSQGYKVCDDLDLAIPAIPVPPAFH